MFCFWLLNRHVSMRSAQLSVLSLPPSGTHLFLSSKCRFPCSVLKILFRNCGLWAVIDYWLLLSLLPWFLLFFVNINSFWVHFRASSLLYLYSLWRWPSPDSRLSIYTIYTLMIAQLTSLAGTSPLNSRPIHPLCPCWMWSSSQTSYV